MSPLAFEVFIFIINLALVVFGVVLLTRSLAFVISLHTGSPAVETPLIYIGVIERALTIRAGDTIYDLGSGNGRLLLGLAQRHPDSRFIGIESNPLLFIYARFSARSAGSPPNLTFKRGNFFDENMRGASAVYGYLRQHVMRKLLPKLEKELRGAKFVSRAFTFEEKTGVPIELSPKPGSHGEHLLHVYEF